MLLKRQIYIKELNMNLVLTMAGKYSRFKLFGSKVPKYLLPLGSGTVLMEVINSLLVSSSPISVLLIANKDDQLFYPILKSVVAKFAIPAENILYIDDTRSQLETALYVSQLIGETKWDNPIVFMNIDTITKNRNDFFVSIEKLAQDSGLVDVFSAASHQYSFVNPGVDQQVLSISDGKPVSQLACSGLYGFGSFTFMMKRAKELLQSRSDANFTDLYNYIIKAGDKVMYCECIDKKNTLVLGTPEEYMINIHRFS